MAQNAQYLLIFTNNLKMVKIINFAILMAVSFETRYVKGQPGTCASGFNYETISNYEIHNNDIGSCSGQSDQGSCEATCDAN